MTDLLIFPYNGNGIEALDCLTDDFNFIGFVDDLPEKQGASFMGAQVMGREVFDKYRNAKVLAVPGGPKSYQERVNNIDSLKLPLERFATVIHPSAQISPFAEVGFNTLIMAGVVITPKARLGNNVVVLPNTVIHHDVTVDDYCWIGSNVVIAGNVSVGRNCFIGSGSSIINNISIGEKALIGIGSNVIHPVGPGKKVAGNPAREITFP